MALRQHPAVRDAAAAVATDAAGHRMLVAYYVPAGEPVAPQDLRGFVGQTLPAPMVPGIFVALTALPLSPNGKLDRRALPAVSSPISSESAGEAPRFVVEEKLAAIWADVLGRPRVGIRDNFFALGGDSILAMMVVSRAARSGLRLTPKSLFENPTIADLASAAEPIASGAEEAGPVVGEVPLTPVQHWFFEHEMVEFGHFNLTTLLESRHPLDASALARAVSLLVMHHDALRLRFRREGVRWRQYNAREETSNIFSVIDLSILPAQIRAGAAQRAQEDLVASLSLAHGPLVRVGLLRAGGGEPDRLLLSAHHLATDAVSGRILVEDLTAAYRQARSGTAPTLPPKTTSFKVWAERLRDYVQSSTELDRELAFWSLDGRPVPAALPADFPAGENTSGSFRTVRIQLGSQEVEALAGKAQAAFGIQLGDLVLTALACAVTAWTGATGLLVDLEWHGREDLFPGIDLSRTVGWFTAIYPVLLEVDVEDPGSALQSVKEQVLRIPRHGIGYGLLRYLRGGDEIVEKLRPLSRAEILFNFLGRIDGGGDTAPATDFVVVPEAETTAGDPLAIRRHLLRVDGFVTGGRLEVVLAYSENLFRRSTIAALADSLLDRLHAIGRHLESPGASGYTPSEFGLVKLGRQQLDRLARKYQKRSVSG
jgi:non-ribosomal peptide synthase protein (TIGR01720 family)